MVPGRLGAQRPAAASVLIVVALALAACSGGSGHGAKRGIATTSTTRSPDAQLRRCATAEQAAMLLHDGWVAHDMSSAKQCATDAAVATLFGAPAAAPNDMFQGCNPQGGPPVRCTYSYQGGTLTFTVSGSAANGFQVDAVSGFALVPSS